MKFKKILVPVDLTVFSDRALEYALRLGIHHQSHITLLYVFDNYIHQDPSIEKQIKEYREILEKMFIRIENKLVEEIGNFNPLAFNIQVLMGKHASDTILSFIDDHSFDLVVMETHARTGLNHVLLGSVTEKVVRHSSKPVLTVHHSLTDYNIRKILVPVDFSIYAKKSVEFAIPFARDLKAELVFLHVIPHEFNPEFHGTGMNVIFQMAPEIKSHTSEKLCEFTRVKGNKSTHIVIEGKPYQSIVEYAAYSQCDLIIMATRGLPGFKHLMLGSTTEKVVRFSECPVLTIGRKIVSQAENIEALEAALQH